MSINKESELLGMKKAGEAVALTLKAMRDHARVGMSTKELDAYGAGMLRSFGAVSAPALAYGFPACTCISVNEEIAHGIPSHSKILKEGDLVNIDVSAELNGFWADNGASFVLGEDIHQHQRLVDASRSILKKAIGSVQSNMRISELGRSIETEAKKFGYNVIKNLAGHGIGRKLHEEPQDIVNYYKAYQFEKFKKNSVVAIETFISTASTLAITLEDNWTLIGNKGGYVAQHEHSIVITDSEAIVLTELNGI